MALYVPDVAEVQLLKRALGQATNGDATLKLFVNDYTPVAGSTAASFTEMSTLSYAAKTLTAGSWAVTTIANVASGTYAQQIWTFASGTPVIVYGYFLVEAAGVLLYAERFATPQTMQFTNDQIKVTPVITLTTA
jgi:hypothetical protein